MHRIYISCLLVLTVSGCTIPLGSEVSLGPPISGDSLAFLGQAGTTRADVLTLLGEPLIEIKNPGALAYVSEMTYQYLNFNMPIPLPYCSTPITTSVDNEPGKEYVLFIAYDEHEYVFAHQIRVLKSEDLKSACMRWRLEAKESPDKQSAHR